MDVSLWDSCSSGDINSIKELLQNGAKVDIVHPVENSSPLFVASQKGHIPVVELLLEHKADVNLGNQGNNASPLYAATVLGSLPIVQLLVGANCDTNNAKSDGTTALYKAAENGFIDIAKILLAKLANVNQTDI